MVVLRNDNESYWNPRKLTTLTSFGGKDSIYPEKVTLGPKRAEFKDANPEVEYTFCVSSQINGKTISRKRFTLKPKQDAKDSIAYNSKTYSQGSSKSERTDHRFRRNQT